MKKKVLSLVAMVILSVCVTTSNADTVIKNTTMNGSTITFENGMVVNYDKDFITVKTRNNTLRIYPCGKVEKLDWKEINPNEDQVYYTVGTYTVPE